MRDKFSPSREPRRMIARFTGTCNATGRPIKKGDRIIWDPVWQTATLDTAPPQADSDPGLAHMIAVGLGEDNY